MKRLVTVLLQEIDSWPEGSLMLAATNHAELLDPAVWRRFEAVLQFQPPNKQALARGVMSFLDDPSLDPSTAKLIVRLYNGETLSYLERDILRARRLAALKDQISVEVLLTLAGERLSQMPTNERGPAAAQLLAVSGLTQRAVHELTGVSRETLRKYASQLKTGEVDGQ